MKTNMNEERKVLLGNANNPIPNIIKPEMVKEAWNCAALTKVLTALGKFLQILLYKLDRNNKCKTQNRYWKGAQNVI